MPSPTSPLPESPVPSDAKLLPFVEAGLRDLSALVALESVSAQRRMLPQTAQAVTDLLSAEGFTVRQYPGQVAPLLIAEAGEGPSTLLIYNHYDVQPETPLELWDSPPFVLTERDGRLYGRGASDDKGEFASRLAAVRAIKARHAGHLPLKIRWLIEGEEEIGSPSLARFVEQHASELSADGCWWEFGSINSEGRPMVSLGLKGVVCLELRCRVADSDLHSSLGAVVDNPLWRLAAAVASLRDSTGRASIAGFHDAIRAPSEADLQAIRELPDARGPLRDTYNITRFLGDDTEHQTRSNLTPAINVNGFHGGYEGEGSKTVLPAAGFVKLDIRLVPDQDPDEIVKLLRTHLDTLGFEDIELIELESSEHAARTSADNPFVKVALQAAREAHGKEPVVSPSSAASGPLYPFVKHLNVPTVIMGIGNIGGRVHAPNENILKRDFAAGVRFGVVFMERLAQAKPS
ncbi:M20/M25/M40 family metallo-hydrolase [Deinococcus psychrotolerans]|uniref:M20/M25/M40 family metallo-hydrolase n=1 Tax=Deinococcus psychrotolerans TaxID=2489213 RepID=A0A3G8YAK3_9DEIO|nr:M20/M25/M40 family metallo-hydrolase [Deinococcus psychrotolerans]AZI42418.1 M20/M25/M40 family metallo-hydrolase [Deinococcus psychrotolerans]